MQARAVELEHRLNQMALLAEEAILQEDPGGYFSKYDMP